MDKRYHKTMKSWLIPVVDRQGFMLFNNGHLYKYVQHDHWWELIPLIHLNRKIAYPKFKIIGVGYQLQVHSFLISYQYDAITAKWSVIDTWWAKILGKFIKRDDKILITN